MAILSISTADHVKIRSSWADVMALNHFKDQNFVHSLFSNLITSNDRVKDLFANKADLIEQEKLFTELLKFTMIYLDKVDILEECMDEFIAENPALVKFGSSYLEPMGAALIKTLRESLGPQKFNSGLETLWIKVYIYIANCILQYDVSDAESLGSNKSKSSVTDEGEVQPLSYKSFSSPMPSFSSPLRAGSSSNTIKINLQANDKYRGFRRSINEAQTTIQVPVPETLSCPSTPEPVITPRCHRRNTSAQLQELGWGVESMRSNSPPSLSSSESFDPRRKNLHKRTPSDMSTGMESPERKVSSSSCESPISDVEDTYHLEDEMNFTPTSTHESRPSVFDYNSFGIKGLAPIAESESDDEKSNYSAGNTSSNYNSIEEREYESSSRTSSLSLHNSDYKSSISSGSGQSRYMDKTPKVHSAEKMMPLNQQFAPPPQFASPYVQKSYSSSVPSLSSRSSGQRASLGFMRSSYILKKEMDDFGCNLPENVIAAIDQHGARHQRKTQSMINAPTSQSLYSARGDRSDQQYGFKYSAPSTYLDTVSKAEVKSERSSGYVSTSRTGSKKEKTSFRKKLGSFFSSSSSSSSANASVPRKRISSPIGISSSSNQKLMQTQTRDSNSIAPSMYSSKCISSADIRASKQADFQPVSRVPSGYAASVYSRPGTENTSAYTRESSSSRHSIFRSHRNPKEDDKKVNKYLVKKVPYKTIYLKDLIA